jgi:hypothetical protein
MTEADEPDDDDQDPLIELFKIDKKNEHPRYVPSWLNAINEITNAVLIVLAIVVAFMVAAVVLRRVWP